MLRFTDRKEAGRLLSRLLRDFTSSDNVVVIALSPSGLPVGEEVAAALGAPLELLRVGENFALRTEVVSVKRTCLKLTGCNVILVDDGFDDTAKLRMAAIALRHQGPARLIAAAPVAMRGIALELAGIVDRVVALAAPRPFHSVRFWYDDSPRKLVRAPPWLSRRPVVRVGRSVSVS